ncbi:uncharacterized protein LOC8287608 isoform X1 [Ricinus communis]|uniref:uncharacterized protein LOC8287608 isoform X1 n=2 Tax=Ricinus communis TaxID=3988 RepID=UPI00201A3B55|nr:uncharacterized protein LOC8287608 isoform X1 [Ricinus communis]XP_015571075.2 uncharacterized protein LOC8287608 isoform X1 [Ricinus communis]
MVAQGGDSSPSWAESTSFRQIDDVFLQTQTRIWLGEVLQTRLSERISITDLLADGELLFEVSRELWKMMLEKHMELKYKYEYEPFASRNSGRYMPYSNVDSFLKICKILGLAGIDIFSPSDVVEKRDTRKVCMCIRALSKKARLRHLNVPDFDIVTCTAAMPTDMVGYIRRSWEITYCDYSNSSSLSRNHELLERSRQKHLNSIAGRSYNYYEESHSAERNFSPQSDSSAAICSYSPTSQISSVSINSPGVSSIVESNYFDQYSEQLDVQNQIRDECVQYRQDAVCLNELTVSCLSHHLEYDQEQDNMPSQSSLDSNVTLGSLDFSAESRARNSHRNTLEDQIYVDPSMEDPSVVGDSAECSRPESNTTDDCPSISAIITHETCPGDFGMLDGKDGLFDACVGVGSFSLEESRTPESKLRSQCVDGDDVEVFSIASVTSNLIPEQNLDFFNHLDAEKAFKNVWVPDSAQSSPSALDEKCKEGSKPQDVIKYGKPGQRLTTNKKEEALHDMKGMDIGFSSPQYLNNCNARYLDPAISYDNSMDMPQTIPNVVDEGEKLFAGQSCFGIGSPQWDQKGKCQIAVIPNTNSGHGASCVSLSPLDLNKENLQLFQKVRGGALCLENMESFVADNDTKVSSPNMVKLDCDNGKQPNQWFSSSCYDDIISRRHEDLNASSNVVVESENVNKDEARNENLQLSTDENSDGVDNPIVGIAECKPQKMPFLKSVVKGTAVLGAMFLLLHFRKSGREKSKESSEQSNRKRNVNGGDFLSVKGQRNHTADGVYPAEKLKLGH